MIYYYIPDFFFNYNVNLKLLEFLRDEPQMFYDDFKIGAIYGNFPNCIWNGGRVSFGRYVNVDEMKYISEQFNSYGVPLRLTMTNIAITDTDIYDRYANYIMENLNNGFNQVLVANPVLEKYIRETYPEYPIVRSIQASDEVYYDDSDKYFMSVINRNKNKDLEFLKNIENKDKIEFVVSETCYEDCNMMIHYKHTSKYQLYEVEENYKCHNMENNKICQQHFTDNPIFITRDKIKNIYEPMGFKHFKISGRELGGNIVSKYSPYMVKPEWKDIFYSAILPSIVKDRM